MKLTIENKIDTSPALKAVHSSPFMLYSAKEWQRILYDDIPHDTDELRRKVRYKPGEIIYFAPHASYIYFGMKMVDPKYKKGGFTSDGGITFWSRPNVKKVLTNEYLNLKNGSRLWDKKAIQEKKDLILIRSMQNWIDRNI